METNRNNDIKKAISIFRSEAVEASTQRFGSPVNPPGVGLLLTTIFVLAILIIATIFLVTTSFPRKETVTGSLVPSRGLLLFTSLRPGIVSTVHVEEGDTVQLGDPILTVSVDSVIGTGESTGDTLSGMAESLTLASQDRELATNASLKSQEDGIREYMEGIYQQLSALRKSVELYQNQLLITKKTVSDLRSLRTDKLVSELQYRDAQVKVLNVEQALVEVQLRISQLEYEYEQKRHELGQLSAERDANRATAFAEQLGVREKALNYKLETEFKIVAQSAGKITWLQAKPGVPISAERTLGAMMPENSQLLAELWVPSSAIAFVMLGTEVRLMYDAYPYQKFGVAHAKIIKIARSPTSMEELPTDIQAKESQYRLLALLDEQHMTSYGKALALTPGMRLKADLVLEKRSLFDWLLEPILAAKHRQK